MEVRPQDIRRLEDIRRAIEDVFRGKRVKVFIFGSRARGDHSSRSDLVLAFLSDEDISYQLSLLGEILEESNLPFTVDLVNLNEAGEELKKAIEEGRLWIDLRDS